MVKRTLKIIDLIVGARPNFMKVAALFAVVDKFPELQLRLIHTGQHYDQAMSEVFFQELNLPKPVKHLEVGSLSHAQQTAEMMKRYEVWVLENRPDMCLVVGDVNSALACALVAAKLYIPICHIEAGLRSFDRRMPEEINRMVTDSLSDLLFVTELAGVNNLIKEGVAQEKIHLVGNVMVDTLLRMKEKFMGLKVAGRFKLVVKNYVFMTLHRPENVDDQKGLSDVCEQLHWLSGKLPVIFSVHPRTKKNLQSFGLFAKLQQCVSLYLIEPVSYLESMNLVTNSKLTLTDSGGLQGETAVLGVPCLILRNTIEQPTTVTEGMGTVIGHDWNKLRENVCSILNGTYKTNFKNIPYWDGKTGKRILEIISNCLVGGDKNER